MVVFANIKKIKTPLSQAAAMLLKAFGGRPFAFIIVFLQAPLLNRI